MKRLFTFVLIVFACFTASAERITELQALQKAQQFMKSKQFTQGSAKAMARSKTAVNHEAYYIFNADDGGFVIVSGDDRTESILGYADSGEIDADNMPDNLRYWLKGYAEQIRFLEQSDEKPASMATARVSKPAIDPLIKTKWNQSKPYALMIPTFKNKSGQSYNSVTGCVATAFAQIMNYYQWPQSCPAIPGYTTKTLEIYRPELQPTTFRWDLMKEKYKYNDTDEAADAVAELMLYVGQAIKTDYKDYASSASVDVSAMNTYFDYSRNAQKVYRDDYSTGVWENIIYNELASKRPVCYSGYAGVGHAFICDGYDGNGLFHLNWGWGGVSDGFFILSLANPAEKGIGGGDGSGGFADGQCAVLMLQPAIYDKGDIPYFESYLKNFKTNSYNRSDVNSDFTDVSTAGCRVRGFLNSEPSTPFSIELGWALFKDGEMLALIDSTSVVIEDKLGSYDPPKTISFGAGLTDGVYRLVMMYHREGATDWIGVTDQQCLYAEIADNTLTLRAAQQNVFYTVNSIDYSGEMGQDTEVDVVMNITNTSDAMKENACFWIEQDEDWVLKCIGVGYIEPGQTGNIRFSFIHDTPGTFNIRVTTDDEGKNVMTTSEVTIFEVKKTTYNGLLFACNTGTKEAKLIESNYSSSNLANVEVPAIVNVDGTDYPVTKIDNNALSYVYTIKEIILPEGLLYIGRNAFRSCSMSVLHLPSTIKEIGDYAFAGCKSLRHITTSMSEPCAINRNVFVIEPLSFEETKVEEFSSAALYVPIGSKTTYSSAAVWNEFPIIYQGELKETTQEDITYYYASGDEFATIIRSDIEALKDKDVVIPSAIEVDGKSFKVREIEDEVFVKCRMKSLTFEPGIEKIGNYVFWNLRNLEKVFLPEGLLYLGEGAFYGSALGEVHLPSTLKSIGDNAFANCYIMRTVVASMTEPCAVSRNVFSNDYLVDDTWTGLFSEAALYVPVGTKSNYTSAEVWNEFKNIYQGERKEITQESITYSFVTGEETATIISCDYAALERKDVVIPSIIEDGGKSYKVVSVENEVFMACPMNSLTIEPGLLYIGESAFRHCSAEIIHLPSTLISIGDYAFANCESLKRIISSMPEPCPISRNVFINRNWINDMPEDEFTSAALYVPDGTKSKYTSTEAWNEFQRIYQGELMEITQEGITYCYASGDEYATIISSDGEALDGKDVVIPSAIEVSGKSYKVIEIEDAVFAGYNLKSLTIGTGIEKIGICAFQNINSLQKAILPEGLLDIGGWAFSDCSRLEEIHLPSTLMKIGKSAFSYCDGLSSIYSYMDEPCTIDRSVFLRYRGENVFSAVTLYVPSGKKEKYLEAEVWKEFTNIVEFDPTEIRSIKADEKNIRIFDIYGRRLTAPRKGINIINGKKVLFE